MAKKENEIKEKKQKSNYFKEMRAELKKVVWPTPKELVNNTIAVIVFVLIIAIIVFIFDFCFDNLNKYGITKLQETVRASFETTDNSEESSENIYNSNIKNMDLILCATMSHKLAVQRIYPELANKIFTLKEYVEVKDEIYGYDIKDPWGYNLKTYENCAKEISECLEKLILKI